MPEELTLLPCPACGKAVEVKLDHMMMEMVYCCGIAAESVEQWNALPRTLTWTAELPKVAGWYWRRSSFGIEVVKIVTVVMWFRDPAEHEWAGPIPAPQEAQP